MLRMSDHHPKPAVHFGKTADRENMSTVGLPTGTLFWELSGKIYMFDEEEGEWELQIDLKE
jgi:hypothetical protein